jgi:hypothetical protein
MHLRPVHVTIIIGFCCFCIASILAAETWFIVTRLFGDVRADIWLGPFLPLLFALLINRRSFWYIIFVVYLGVGAEVTREAWLVYVGIPLKYVKSVTPWQGLMVIVSFILFLLYLVAAGVRVLEKIVKNKTER